MVAGIAHPRVAHDQRRLLPRRKIDDLKGARDVKMELITKSGKTIVLKPKVALQDGEIIDSMFMSRKALLAFYEAQIDDAHKTGVLFSLHVKATMMKVSHPIVFGHCVRMFYKEAFEKHGALFDSLGVNVNNGMADLYNKIAEPCRPRSAKKSSATCTPARNTVRRWPWSTRPRASPTSIRRTT
jgi:monomeric type NADP-dependent isocitrate dehydrogenase